MARHTPRTAEENAPHFATIRLSSLSSPDWKLDAKHYQREFIVATQRALRSGYEVKNVSDLADAFVPKRIKLITVQNSDAGAPYLKAHDAFMTRPPKRRFMSAVRTPDYESYLLREGQILTPSSGRNLGPIAYVGPYLAQYAMTDIMRIIPNDSTEGFYLLGYLMTPTAQALIRRGRTGTTVDHLSPTDVLSIAVVWLPGKVRESASESMRRSMQLLDEGRQELDELEMELHCRAGLALPVELASYLAENGPRAFSFNASTLQLRIDAAFYDPTVQSCKRKVQESGGVALHSCADLRMLGRYKRYYVALDHGTPILSGRQLLQLRPVNLKHISNRSFTTPSDFIIRRGWTLFTCDGRSEESLGAPSFVSSLRDGWMASNHIMRAIPRSHIPPGYLYLALRSPYVQIQLKARATGSVVDALDPTSISDVMVPMLAERDRVQLGRAAESAWEKIADSVRSCDTTVGQLETLIVEGYESTRMATQVIVAEAAASPPTIPGLAGHGGRGGSPNGYHDNGMEQTPHLLAG